MRSVQKYTENKLKSLALKIFDNGPSMSIMVEKKARVSKTENFEFRLENFIVG